MDKDLKAVLDRTKTPEGEVRLLEDAMEGDELAGRWVEMVRRGVAGDRAYEEVVRRPLVKALVEYTSSVMAPEVDNFTKPERTPWGGRRIVTEMKRGLLSEKKYGIVGESWEVSGHPKFRNVFRLRYEGVDLDVDVGILEEMFSHNLYGSELNERLNMPFLVKLLNSGGWEQYKGKLGVILTELDGKKEAAGWRKTLGLYASLTELASRNYDEIHRGLSTLEELVKGDYPQLVELRYLHREMLAKNLSVQVHPDEGYEGLKEGEHSKTEAWYIVDAEEGAGIYLGLKEGVTRKRFAEVLVSGGDVTALLNFVPVSSGDVFFIPAGTIHAIGAGVVLVEPQETSETTYRVYDYGRQDDKGNPRQLHVDQAMAVTTWDGPRGADAVSSYRRVPEVVPGERIDSAVVERVLDERLFRVDKLTFQNGERFETEGAGFTSYTVIEGAVRVAREADGAPQGEFFKGQSFIVPAAMGAYSIQGSAQRSVLIETRKS